MFRTVDLSIICSNLIEPLLFIIVVCLLFLKMIGVFLENGLFNCSNTLDIIAYIEVLVLTILTTQYK